MGFPSVRNHFNVFFYDGLNNSNLLFLEAMIIHLFDWRDILQVGVFGEETLLFALRASNFFVPLRRKN